MKFIINLMNRMKQEKLNAHIDTGEKFLNSL